MGGNTKRIPLQDILAFLTDRSFKTVGRVDGFVFEVRSIAKCTQDNHLTFCTAKGAKSFDMIRSLNAGIVICPHQDYPTDVAQKGVTLIMTDNPRLIFLRVAKAFFVESKPHAIHPTAVINTEAKISPNVSIGANCFVGKAEIGDESVLHEGVIVRDGTRIGKRVEIFPGVVIGGDGYGNERNENGVLEKFPHFGGVVIEDDVEIGSNTCIDRGTLDDTRIRARARIDNMVHIAHNVDIGEDAAITAQSLIAGSSFIGKGAWLSPGAVICNKIRIGENSVVGLGAVVTKDVSPNTTVLGNPAREQSQYKKMMGALSLLAKKTH